MHAAGDSLPFDMADIHNRLLQVEEHFFSALSNDTLDAFQQSWSRLSDDIAVAVQAEQLPDDIQTLAHMVATRIHVIATGFFELNAKHQELTTSFLQRVEDVLGGEVFCVESTGDPIAIKPALPPYIPLAHMWLLDNLHCPYPSVSMRNSLSKQSGSTRKAIDGWFVEVRKRIGWNALRKSQFSGKKEDIVKAAIRFFCEGKGEDGLASEFASIQLKASELYAEKLHPSALGSRFAEALDNFASKRRVNQAASINRSTTYPSPRSQSSSLPPSPIIPPSQTISVLSKRRRSPEEDEDSSVSYPCRRLSKRQRFALLIGLGDY